ncbi:hypothetical protein GCM10008018_14670 [Paenibacillus marchantiophytorum]|uniref:Uncharacterized protein n=1 Tax=Paenibacillus marchantiophytorum TaxID=1619310 RepID=A0ABQ2BUE1_9BACL|nr:hypothetical protein [Paenibacillus marchantiophytorum]GGI45947.1 hypothetical protein GCM10008018_14670 [Paenibacillus marchantiophytorum]
MWFQKKKVPPPPPLHSPAKPKPESSLNPTPTDQTPPNVQQLEKRLKQLEEDLAKLVTKHPQIHIDVLHVHQPVLENLTFRLDHLDIKELSGSLNLGNNFGAKPTEKKGPLDEAFQRAQVTKDGDSGAVKDTTSPPPEPERTATGYRYTPQFKK